MTTRRWVVRRSHFPLALPGEKLGVVEAPDRYGAGVLATAQFGSGMITVEPESHVNPELERVVAKAVKAAGQRRGRPTRSDPKGRGSYGRSRLRQQPLNPTLTNPDPDEAA